LAMIYTIKAGCNYSGFRFSPFLKRPVQEYLVSFDPSCIYDIGKERSDWSKLFGQTHGLPRNSSRWAWRWNVSHDAFQVMPYMHERGIIRRGSPIIDVRPTSSIVLGIVPENDNIVFTVNGNLQYIWTPPTDCTVGYRQWPYYGGNMPAPHEMKLSLA